MIDKETFTVHEKVPVKLEFTNLSGNTLCFPDPDRTCSNTGSGSLLTRAEPKTGDSDFFMCHFCGGGTWPREKLLREIEERWIKIAQNAVYVTNAGHVGDLTAPGQWRLQSIYNPPQGAFNPTEFRKYVDSAAESIGCTVPKMEVKSKPAVFHVVAKKDDD
jgi:hypothetical protein